jgi:hypothetical protein
MTTAMVVDHERILAGPEYFWCGKLTARIRECQCLTNQKEANRLEKNGAWALGRRLACLNCREGKEIKARSPNQPKAAVKHATWGYGEGLRRKAGEKQKADPVTAPKVERYGVVEASNGTQKPPGSGESAPGPRRPERPKPQEKIEPFCGRCPRKTVGKSGLCMDHLLESVGVGRYETTPAVRRSLVKDLGA